MVYSFLFILGAAVGSFLNVVISRLPKEESIVLPASHCPICQHKLSVLDLIPLLSFLCLRGKCRYCKAVVSSRHFFVELLSALLFVLTGLYFGVWWESVFVLVFLSILIVIAFIDLETQMIPEILFWLGGMVGVVYALLKGDWLSMVLGGVFGFGFFFLISKLALWVYRKEVLGFGDVELGVVLGIFLGWPLILYAVFWSYMLSGVVVLLLLLFGKVTLRDEIPFAPFLILGALYVLFWGTPLYFW